MSGLARLLIGPATTLLPDLVRNAGITPAINGRVLLYALGLSVFAAIVFGLAPAWRAVRGPRPTCSRPIAAATRPARHGRFLRHAFTVMEVAVALVLLAGAGVLVRGFARLQQVDPGFDRENVLTMRLSLPRERYDRARVAAFFEDLSTRLEGVPGVTRAAAATQFPPDNGFTARVEAEGEAPAVNDVREIDVTNVTERFFATLGYTIAPGPRVRGHRSRHGAAGGGAQRSRGATALRRGRRRSGAESAWAKAPTRPWIEVVGIAREVRNRGLDADPAPEVFIPVRQMDAAWNNQLFLLVKTAGAPGAMLASVRRTIATMDADQPVYAIKTIDEAFAESSEQRRAAAAAADRALGAWRCCSRRSESSACSVTW